MVVMVLINSSHSSIPKLTKGKCQGQPQRAKKRKKPDTLLWGFWGVGVRDFFGFEV